MGAPSKSTVSSPTMHDNFKLLAHHGLNGFGGMGEGMSIQIATDGRRILWLAHESAPKNFTGVDVSDPRSPKIVVQTDLPAGPHALELAGDGRQHHGRRLPGPEARAEAGRLRAVRHLRSREAEIDRRSSTPRARARAACTSSGSATARRCTWPPARRTSSRHNPLDDQFYRAFDVRNPSKPVEVSRWWMPGTRDGDGAPPPVRHKPPRYDMGFRAHNTNVYPQRPDRCYLGYIDGGMFILDISDKANPKPLCRWDNSPPFSGFTHTVLPLFERELLVVTDESVVDDAKDWPKLIWILDGREETNPVPIATCPVEDVEDYAHRGGRFGAHNIHENVPRPTSWHSDRIILGTFFNGGLRAYDIADPYRPEEVGVFVPPAPTRRAQRHHPAQRRVRRRAPCRLHRRPPCRRALYPGNGFRSLI